MSELSVHLVQSDLHDEADVVLSADEAGALLPAEGGFSDPEKLLITQITRPAIRSMAQPGRSQLGRNDNGCPHCGQAFASRLTS
jgi:hypothetical protein